MSNLAAISSNSLISGNYDLKNYGKTQDTSNSASTTFEDEFSISDSSSAFSNIVKKYNLNDISASDMKKMGNELYSNNLISNDEKNLLDKSASYIPLATEGVAYQENGGTENTKMDYYNMWQTANNGLKNSTAKPTQDAINEYSSIANLFSKIKTYQDI